ncbi:MAG: hypothetical protein HQ594_06075 [Candidatus Omnitrophica bacterium]|nr:hypothetical protein [Candidatus Omnitrophota bacterium]
MRMINFVKISFLVMLFGVCAGGTLCFSENLTTEELFSLGNDFYEKGEYGRALAEYEEVLKRGHESGALYFNIADACFKEGQLGKAVLNYERAKILLPRDADIIANYRFARASIKTKIIAPRGIWSWGPLKTYSGKLNVNEFTWFSSILYLLILLFLSVTIVRANITTFQVSVIVLMFFLIILNVVVIGHKLQVIKKGAITIVPKAEAMFGPFDSATKFFTLHEGVMVTVLKSKDDWYKVRRADDKVGWIHKDAVEKITGE